MFRSSENLRLAAEMRALQRVAAPWREARTSWFDGTPDSIAARIAATDRVLAVARAGYTQAHVALEREAAAARTELLAAQHRLMTDFLDDGARVAGKHDPDPERPWKNQATGEDTPTDHWENLHLSPFDDVDDYEGKHRKSNRRVAVSDITLADAYDGEEGDEGWDDYVERSSKVPPEFAWMEGRTGPGPNPYANPHGPLGPGYDRPGFGPDDISEYEDYLRGHGYHTGSQAERPLVHPDISFSNTMRLPSDKEDNRFTLQKFREVGPDETVEHRRQNPSVGIFNHDASEMLMNDGKHHWAGRQFSEELDYQDND